MSVDAEERFLRGAHVIRGKVDHRVGDLAHDGQHGLAQLGFELRLARLKPGAVVMLGQIAQEGESFGTEVGESGGSRL